MNQRWPHLALAWVALVLALGLIVSFRFYYKNSDSASAPSLILRDESGVTCMMRRTLSNDCSCVSASAPVSWATTAGSGVSQLSTVRLYADMIRSRPNDEGLKLSFVHLLVMEGDFGRASVVARAISTEEPRRAALEHIARGLSLIHEGKPLPGAQALATQLEQIESMADDLRQELLDEIESEARGDGLP